MSTLSPFRSLLRPLAVRVALATALCPLLVAGVAWGQNPPGGGGGGAGVPNTLISFGAVGGVAIDAQGVLNNLEVDQLNRLRAVWEKAVKQVPGEISEPSELRKVSLRRLEAAIAEHLANGQPLPDEIRLLGGLQQIRYVFVFPEENDIVLAGFGEGWRVDDRGTVVGMTTGLPVLQLDDLLVALRTADAAARTGISCSIDPTPEGLARLQQFVKSIGQVGNDPRPAIAGIEQSLGPQKITIAGVPASSHFAQVLVAADYRMKRLAMGFEPSPVKGMPSFLQMSKGSGNMMPRWWLAPNYEPLLKDPEGLAWELRGSSVKALTEDSVLAANGQLEATGKGKKAKVNPVAQKWADSMTAHYEELSQKLPIFAELSNLMDLAVVGALIAKENLPGKAGLSMPILTGAQELAAAQFDAPRQVDSKATFVKKGDSFVISASGGVLIDSWSIAGNSQASASLVPVRKQALPTDPKRWWWN